MKIKDLMMPKTKTPSKPANPTGTARLKSIVKVLAATAAASGDAPTAAAAKAWGTTMLNVAATPTDISNATGALVTALKGQAGRMAAAAQQAVQHQTAVPGIAVRVPRGR